MDAQFVLFSVNAVLNVGWIIGMGVWAGNTSLWANDSYGFGWFTSITGFLVCVFALLFHNVPAINKRVNVFPNYQLYVWLSVSGLYAIFTLASSASIAAIITDCRTISDVDFPSRGYYKVYVQSAKDACNGVYVATSFGFVSFVVWMLTTWWYALGVYYEVQHKKSQNAKSQAGETDAPTEPTSVQRPPESVV